MADAPRNFDDPAFKAAIRRACGGERGSEALRQRVRAAIHDAGETPPLRVSFWQRPVFRVAASLLLVLIGMYALLVRRSSAEDELFVAIVARHDGCCQVPMHQGAGIPQGDFHLMGQAMASNLHVQVLAASAAGDWNFKGAALCPVNGQATAHLVFASRRGHLSMFSIPPAAAPGMTDSSGIAIHHVSGHGIASFVQQGVVYALVSDGEKPLADDELRQMLGSHKGDLITAAVALGILPVDAGIR